MGFDADSSRIHIIHLVCLWDHATSDDIVFEAISGIIKAIKRDVTELGVQNNVRF